MARLNIAGRQRIRVSGGTGSIRIIAGSTSLPTSLESVVADNLQSQIDAATAALAAEAATRAASDFFLIPTPDDWTIDDPFLSRAQAAVALPFRPKWFISSRLLAGYVGPSIRIRRTDTSAETDIGWDPYTKGWDFYAIRSFIGYSAWSIIRAYNHGTDGGYLGPYGRVLDGDFAAVRDSAMPLLLDNARYGEDPEWFTSLVPDAPVAWSRQSVSAFMAVAPSSIEASVFLTMFSSNSPLTESFNLMNFASPGTPTGVGLHTAIDGSLSGPVVSSDLVTPAQPCVIGFTSSGSAFKHWLDGENTSHTNLASGSIVGFGLALTTLGDNLFGNYRCFAFYADDTPLSDDDANAVTFALNNIVRRPEAPLALIEIDGDSRCCPPATTRLQGWVRMLDALVGDKVKIYNLSYPGKRASQSAANFATVVAPHYRADIPCFYFNLNGVNDIDDGETGVDVLADIQSAGADATALGFRTIVATAYPIDDWVGSESAELDDLNDGIRAGVGTDYEVVLDLGGYAPFLDTGNPDVMPDGVHLSTSAQRSIPGFASGALGRFLDWSAVQSGGGGSGSGDVVGPAAAVDGEIALFDLTTGKLIKRATQTGMLKATAGVLVAAVAGTDYLAPAAIGVTVQGYDAVLAATTASFLTAHATKLGYISITQAVDLDAIETRVNDLDASVVLRGTWDASAGTFPGGGTAQAGSSWIVSVAGTVNSIAFAVGDRIIAILDNASTSTFASNWFKADYTDQVSSVAGLTGTPTITQIMDVIGSTRGSIVYRGASAWSPLTPGTLGLPLISGGSGADPSYGTLITASYGNSTITLAKIANGTALSVLGVTGNAGAAYADIVAGLDGQVLRRSGSTVVFATIATASIADAAVTLAKMADMATGSLLGRNTAGTGVPEVLSAATVKSLLGITAGVLYGPGPHILIEDQKTSGSAGGTFTSGADRTRDLNTEVYDPNGWCTLASNQFTLPAGTYVIAWSAPAYGVDFHQTLLYNVTDAAEVKRGSSDFSYSGAALAISRSVGAAAVTIAGSKAFEVRHRCQTTFASAGLGGAASFGTEVYTQVSITRVA